MRIALLCIVLLFFAGCSVATKDPGGPVTSHCAKPEKPEQEPIDSGLGGTGALPQEDCSPSPDT